MRWLMIGLLVSLGALLLAAGGVARHILKQRANLRRESVVKPGPARNQAPHVAFHSTEDTDTEP